MNSQFSHAEDTAALLLQSEQSGSTVMIPGAFERRVRAAAGPLVHDAGQQAANQTYGVAVSDPERLVYEREGGGAPIERSGGRAATILRKFWKNTMNGRRP
jgi:hypothetical protein